MKLIAAALVLTSLAFWSFAGTAADSTLAKRSRSVLITSGGSDLELTVIKTLTNQLSDVGVLVTTVPLKDFQKMPVDSFGAVVVLGAIDKTRLRTNVQEYLNRFDQPWQQSTVIIATVTGVKWREKESVIDAVTAASTTLEPRVIASKLYTKITAILKIN